MEIPQDVLENLRCSICENYLSRSPVYLETGEVAVCGQCISPDRLAFRNKQYETLAKVMMFPCKNRDLGCLEKVPFAEESENLSHEEVCPYRQYICPIMGSAHCEWVGKYEELSKHCEEQHKDRIQDSPITLTYDISKSEQKNFILRAYQLLFLLHTKVCVTSGKIYHGIRYFGLSDEALNFKFNIDIERETVTLSRKECVVEQGCLAIQEDTSLVLKINSLLDVLGGFKGSTFTITIIRNLPSAIINCIKCKVLVTDLVHRTAEGWCCANCAPPKLNCSSTITTVNYCSYQDTIEPKLQKHKLYFCGVDSYFCTICKSRMPGSPSGHYKNKHQSRMYRSGSIWLMKWSADVKPIYLTCVAGTAVFKYSSLFNNNNIQLFLPVCSNRLHEFKCTVRIKQIATSIICIYKPEILYNEIFDWGINIKKTDFADWSYELLDYNNTFEVCVVITRVITKNDI